VSIDPPDGLYAIERRDVVIDASRFQHGTGWAPVTSLDVGITKMVRRVVSGRQQV